MKFDTSTKAFELPGPTTYGSTLTDTLMLQRGTDTAGDQAISIAASSVNRRSASVGTITAGGELLTTSQGAAGDLRIPQASASLCSVV